MNRLKANKLSAPDYAEFFILLIMQGKVSEQVTRTCVKLPIEKKVTSQVGVSGAFT